MSGPNVIQLHPNPPARSAIVEDGPIAMLVFVIFEIMMFAGMVGAFMLTRTAANATWPPPGQPWFPPGETAINTTALLASGGLIFLAARAWEKQQTRIGPLLFTAIVLGVFFVFFQSVLWVNLTRQGLTLLSSHHGRFFCFIVGMHGLNAVGALIFLGVAWLRLRPFRDDGAPRGSLSNSTFSAARILWYFVAGAWPVLYVCLYL